MDPLAIILMAVFVQVALTFWAIIRMGLARVAALRDGKVTGADIALSSTAYPDTVKQLQANAHNQFETPVLLYAGAALAAALGAVNWVMAVASVCFIATRLVHRAIHVGANRLGRRFRTYALGLLALLIFWTALAVELVI